MDNKKLELSARYYVAETVIGLLGAILIVSRFVGLDASQRVPVLKIVLEDMQNYPRVVAALLMASTLYLLFEWKQSPKESRKSYWSQARAGITTVFAFTSLWLSYPVITINTGFAIYSPGWFLGFLLIGFILGEFISILVFSSFMIRTQEEARNLNLPRIPVATRAQYTMCIPIVILLLVAFFILRHYSPEIIKEFRIEFILICLTSFFVIGEQIAVLFLSQDESGNRIPLAKKIKNIKEAHNVHDYSYDVFNIGKKIIDEKVIDLKAPPQEIQKALQKMNAEEPQASPYRGKLLETIQLALYYKYKDGDQKNKSPENRGLKIEKQQGKKDLLRVLITFKDADKDAEKESQELEIPIDLIESCAEEYLATNTSDDDDLELEKFFPVALNQAIDQTISKEAEPFLLLMAALRGLEDQVVGLLKQDIDVNKSQNGWTSLLHASANGYPRICRILLDAAANPDIGNINSITPLMYGARYGNLEICKILLDFGANTDLKDVYGDTALIIASSGGHVNIVDKLLEAGADTTIKNRNDMTALDIAHKNKQGEIAKRLRLR